MSDKRIQITISLIDGKFFTNASLIVDDQATSFICSTGVDDLDVSIASVMREIRSYAEQLASPELSPERYRCTVCLDQGRVHHGSLYYQFGYENEWDFCDCLSGQLLADAAADEAAEAERELREHPSSAEYYSA